MDNKKQIGFEELDNAKKKIQDAAMAFKKMLAEIGADPKYLRDCDIIYKYIHKIPHGGDLLKMSTPPQMPNESVQVNVKSQDSTLRKAADIAKDNETDIVLNEKGVISENISQGNHRWGVTLQGSIFTPQMSPEKAAEVAEEFAMGLRNTYDGSNFRVIGDLKYEKSVGGGYQEEPDPDSSKGMDDAYVVKGESYKVVKAMTAKTLKESLGLKPKVLTETITVGELKKRMLNKG